jgi:integrase
MKPSSRVIWKADKKLNSRGNIGYLYLSTRTAGKQLLRSIELPAIDKRFWLKTKGLVSESYPKNNSYTAEKINTYISQKLKEASLAHHDFRYLPDEKKSFSEYWKQEIDLTRNHGTKAKYENVRNLLLEYAKTEYKAMDIKFKDIQSAFIKGFYNYLRSKKTKCTHNTANYKIKSFQSILNRAINQGVYHYVIHPFGTYEFTFEEVMIKELLSMEELDRLFNTQYYEVIRSNHKFGQRLSDEKLNDPRYRHEFSLEDYRNFWLFQLFAQGLRVSDLITLRWNDFTPDENAPEQIRIIKRQFKTKSFVTVFLNDKLIDILTPYVLKQFNEVLPNVRHKKITAIATEIHKLKEQELKIYANIKSPKRKPSPVTGGILYSAKKYYQREETKINELNESLRKHIKSLLAWFSQDATIKNSFVFGLLKNEEFADVDEKNDFGTLSKQQYTRVTGQRAYYNRLLKCISKQSGIKKKLTSHLARHSYTSLMTELGEDINLFDVMNSLGHKHISTTQVYLQKFTNKKLDNVNKILSEKLNAKWTLGSDGKPFNPLHKKQ